MISFGADFRHRLLSGIVMVAAALGTAWAGGIVFAVFWTLAGIAVLWEWGDIARLGNRRIWLAASGLALVAGAVCIHVLDYHAGLIAVLLGAAACAFTVPRQSGFAVAGVLAAAAASLPVIAIRGEGSLGLVAVLYLCAVVWATDIFAYLVGRSVGGPKLWPRVSPNKTRSGAIGGTAAGVGAGVLVGAIAGLPSLLPLAVLALVLSVCSQAGDLAESALKRHLGVKDAGRLIPGHGGLLDRLDGFAAAALVALLVVELRHAETAAAGLLLW